jgi:hypothetical protein
LGPISLVEKGKLERHASRAAGQNCAGIARDVVSILKVLPRVLRNGRADERRLQIATNSRAATIDLDMLAPIGP